MTTPRRMPEHERLSHPSALPSTAESFPGESPLPVFHSPGLLQGGREIMIRHGNECALG